MSVVAELLALAGRAAAALAPPAVAQAFFPPDREGAGMSGEFCALRLGDGSVGTAFVLLGDTRARSASPRSTPSRNASSAAPATSPTSPPTRSARSASRPATASA